MPYSSVESIKLQKLGDSTYDGRMTNITTLVIAGRERELTPSTYEHVSGSTRYIEVSEDAFSIFFEHLNWKESFSNEPKDRR